MWFPIFGFFHQNCDHQFQKHLAWSVFFPYKYLASYKKKENLTITYRDIRGHSFSTYASKGGGGGGGGQANAYSYKNIKAKQYR